MARLTYDRAHEIAREGSSIWGYRFVRVLLVPIFRILFAMRVSGLENVPAKGAAVIAPNHKSFWDGFFIAAVAPRRVFFMGKSELFEGPQGRFLLWLGGFPVKRGQSDGEAIETAMAILRRGDLLSLFPEGTRVKDPEALGSPRKGAARIAIETGAPIVPCAITGTEKRRLPLPRKVQVTFGEPIPVSGLDATPEDAGELMDELVWPAIAEDYHSLRARPGLIVAGLAAVGLGIAVRQIRKR
ncbi:1-acyl-sn-glycerol-3-phosphate acyltransferase [Nocardioides humilatus]|uniref:1-acyl-sn-glycerol-3-phosphate acyltransferase n=1 Tax=Nocardioides humilatus TaxID=2607660 RepID=A0A5B1LFW8_9ACTN|nr:lysophospholipid acyltransferase family protein [Nocardioides humilatus]KAA1419326.1 1-acyl-sn-glycerol-3-phosphate acyltransferase [Nocardioides humilatus]